MDDYSLTSYSVPTDVEGIGDDAFRNHTLLEYVEIPDNIIRFFQQTFLGCSSLREVYIPDSVTDIGYSTFLHCTSLQSVRLPSTLTRLDMQTFGGCSSLTEIEIPDNITYVYNGMFSVFGNCPAARYVNPDSVTAMTMSEADVYFRVCGNNYDQVYTLTDGTVTGTALCNIDSSLTSFEVPAEITEIRETAFDECAGLMNITVSPGHPLFSSLDGVLCSLDQTTLLGIPMGRTGVFTVPDSVTTLSLNLFLKVKGLTRIVIPDSVTTLIKGKFDNLRSWSPMLVVNADSAAWSYAVSNRLNFVLPGEEDYRYYVSEYSSSLVGYTGNETKLVLPETLGGRPLRAIYTEILAGTQVIRLTIPEGVTSINALAFKDAPEGLTLVVAPQSTAYEFAVEHNIPWIPLGEEDYTFTVANGEATLTGYTGSSTELVLPDTLGGVPLTAIGKGALANSAIVTLTIPSGIRSLPDNALKNSQLLQTVNLPDGLTSIGASAFQDCKALETVDLPASLSALGARAFSGSGLTAITIPSSVTAIPTGCFSSCEDLLEVSIPPTVMVIGAMAFEQCTSLQEIMLPKASLSIGEYAFSQCTGLTKVIVPGRVEQINSLAFDGHSASLVLWVQPNSAALQFAVDNSISYVLNVLTGTCGEEVSWMLDDEACLTVTGTGTMVDYSISDGLSTAPWGLDVRSVIVENGVTHVGDAAFVGCAALARVLLPESITSIGEQAFSDCGPDLLIVSPWNVCVREFAARQGIAWQHDQHHSAEAAAIEPTCTEAGRTEGTICDQCGEILTGCEPIAPGHIWGDAVYVWADEGNALAAVRVCQRDAGHTDQIQAFVTRTILSPTQEEEGSVTDTAVFAQEELETQTRVSSIPTLGTLQVLYLPEGLLSVEEEAFCNLACQAVIIPDGCASIGPKAFMNCDQLIYLQIPADTDMDSTALAGCGDVIVDRVSK